MPLKEEIEKKKHEARAERLDHAEKAKLAEAREKAADAAGRGVKAVNDVLSDQDGNRAERARKTGDTIGRRLGRAVKALRGE